MSGPATPAPSRWLGRTHLFSWRGLQIPSYTAMLYLGCVAGVLVGAAVAQARGMDPTRFAAATTVLLVPAFAGARLWFVATHRGGFRSHPRRIWRRSEGGWALYGGLASGFCASVPLLALAGIPLWRFWDAASVTMLVGLALTRVGCLMNGCCVGRPTSSRLGVWLPDQRGVWGRRVPTQLLEAVWAVAVVAVVLGGHGRLTEDGVVFLGVVGAYGMARLVLEPMRAAAKRDRRVNLAVSAALIVAAAVTLFARFAA